ncbi:leucine-rich repeat extensin-like protein 3 [Vigna angularis]|uniref:leucine-rich repeat extensin-like protein 3 n=1 Tax=Phaseolus angularis TaxID=3914 RepID=UPI0022B2CD42|nr:leucine-rich repeat extensin-like protein 3 [Vigna angularis]
MHKAKGIPKSMSFPSLSFLSSNQSISLSSLRSHSQSNNHPCNPPAPPQDPPHVPRPTPIPSPAARSRVHHKLKDLFVSSPPPPLNEDKTIFHQQQQQRKEEEEEEENKDLPVELIPNRPEPPPPHRISLPGHSATALRPVSFVFRYRLLRRAWRRKIPRSSPRRSHVLAAASSSPPPRPRRPASSPPRVLAASSRPLSSTL